MFFLGPARIARSARSALAPLRGRRLADVAVLGHRSATLQSSVPSVRITRLFLKAAQRGVPLGRRHEITILESDANSHRAVLEHYSPYFLDQMIGIVTASTVMSYALYTISDETVKKFGTRHLFYTVPFVLYGIFRYLYLVHKREEGGNPTRLALTDRPLLINIILWIIVASVIIYGR